MFKKSDFRIVRRLGKGKSGVSWLAMTASGTPVVLKEMHDEEVFYYSFAKDKLELELEAYGALAKSPVRLPALLGWNRDEKFLVKEYIEGPTAAEAVADGTLDGAVFGEAVSWSASLRERGMNIDWFPANFVVKDGLPHYVDYEWNPWSDEWSFENWGIWYWLNGEGMKAFLSTGDHGKINLPGTGKPVIMPGMEERRKEILSRYHAVHG